MPLLSDVYASLSILWSPAVNFKVVRLYTDLNDKLNMKWFYISIIMIVMKNYAKILSAECLKNYSELKGT